MAKLYEHFDILGDDGLVYRYNYHGRIDEIILYTDKGGYHLCRSNKIVFIDNEGNAKYVDKFEF